VSTSIDPVLAVGTGLPSATMPAGEPLMQSSLQALHQAAHAPDVVGRGVRSEAAGRPSAPMQLLDHLTRNVIAPGRAELAQPPALPTQPDGTPMDESAMAHLQRVSQFAIQASVQLASESTMLSVTSALASAANTTFHQLLSSNE